MIGSLTPLRRGARRYFGPTLTSTRTWTTLVGESSGTSQPLALRQWHRVGHRRGLSARTNLMNSAWAHRDGRISCRELPIQDCERDAPVSPDGWKRRPHLAMEAEPDGAPGAPQG